MTSSRPAFLRSRFNSTTTCLDNAHNTSHKSFASFSAALNAYFLTLHIMSFATANVVSMNALAGSCTPFPQRTIRPRQMRRSLMVRAEQQQENKPQNLRDEVRGAPGISVPDKGEKDSYE